MTRLMYDSLDASAIPVTATMVAGYTYRMGAAIWSESDWARFPNATKVTISTSAGYAADVWDAESGDGSPSDIVTFRETCTNAGMTYCTVYAGKNAWLPEILSLIESNGLSDINIWDSDATGVAHLNSGSVATQYAVSSQSGGDYDLSLVADYWPGVDSVPVTPVNSVEDNEMLIVTCSTAKPAQPAILVIGNSSFGIPSAADAAALEAAGVKVANVSPTLYENIAQGKGTAL